MSSNIPLRDICRFCLNNQWNSEHKTSAYWSMVTPSQALVNKRNQNLSSLLAIKIFGLCKIFESSEFAAIKFYHLFIFRVKSPVTANFCLHKSGTLEEIRPALLRCTYFDWMKLSKLLIWARNTDGGELKDSLERKNPLHITRCTEFAACQLAFGPRSLHVIRRCDQQDDSWFPFHLSHGLFLECLYFFRCKNVKQKKGCLFWAVKYGRDFYQFKARKIYENLFHLALSRANYCDMLVA